MSPLSAFFYVQLIIALISSFAAFATFYTYYRFLDLRKPVTRIVMYLALTLGCMNIVDFLMVFVDPKSQACKIVGIFPHYFLLATFFWMVSLATIYYLVVVTQRNVEEKYYTMIHINSWGWALLFPIITVSIGAYGDTDGRCWIADQAAIVWLLRIPIIICLVYNTIVFFLIFRFVKQTFGNAHMSSSARIRTELKILVLTFLALGLAWIFGYLSVLFAVLGWKSLASVFDYGFAILSLLPGLVLFNSYVYTPQVRAAYRSFPLELEFWKQYTIETFQPMNPGSSS